jgi:YHS domain-containing protein
MFRRLIRTLPALTCILAVGAMPAIAVSAVSAEPAIAAKVNVDAAQVALEGSDPVALFTTSAILPGKPDLTATHAGATYRFSSPENRTAFQADPGKYAPQFGGFCAFGVSKGKLFPVELQTWQIVNGKLYLNKNLEVKAKMNADLAGVLAKAEQEWVTLTK